MNNRHLHFTRKLSVSVLASLLLIPSVLSACSAGADSELDEQAEQEFIIDIDPDFKIPKFCDTYKSCTTSSECPTRETCWRGQCRIEPMATFCESSTVSRNNAGDRVDCASYACNQSNGQCYNFCTSTLHCAPGWICDMSSNRCVTPTLGIGTTEVPLPPTTPVQERDRTCPAKRCNTHADCGDQNAYMCHNGQCMKRTRHCIDRHTATTPWTTENCGIYSCAEIYGECNFKCLSSAHCASGFACDLSDGVCKH